MGWLDVYTRPSSLTDPHRVSFSINFVNHADPENPDPADYWWEVIEHGRFADRLIGRYHSRETAERALRNAERKAS